MKYYTIKDETLTDIADAIREKTGTAYTYSPTEMTGAIGAIKTTRSDFNLAYGDIAPKDAKKLWVKSNPPIKVKFTCSLTAANEEMVYNIGAIGRKIYSAAAAAVGTKVYLFGGESDEAYLDTIYMWDAEAYTISKLNATLPAPVKARYLSAIPIGKKIYLFGGWAESYGPQSAICVFDTEEETVSTLDVKLAESVCRIASVAIGTKIYLFGGMNRDFFSTSTIQVFDTEANTISTLGTTLSPGMASISVAAVGTDIYLLGGELTEGWSNKIYKFDTKTYILSTLSETLPDDVGVAYNSSAKLGDKLYLFGGITSNNNITNVIGVFDLKTHCISTLSATLPTKTEFMAAAAVGTKVYLFGGSNGDSVPGISNAIHEFISVMPLEKNTLLLSVSITNNLFHLIDNGTEAVEIGVERVYIGNADGIAERVPAAVYTEGVWVEI